MKTRRFVKSSLVLAGVLLLVVAVLVSGCTSTPAASPTAAAPAGQGSQAPAATTAPAAPAATTAPSSGASSSTGRDYILIGLPNPSTGAIASFGESKQWAADRALEFINKDGGIMVDGKKMPVKVKIVDTESSPTKAAEVATQLILNDKIDLMLVANTPDTVNPVSAACERYQVPCISVDAPLDAWLTGGPYKWSYHASFSVNNLNTAYMDEWDMVETNKIVGGLFSNDPDGVTISADIAKKCAERGYKFIDTGKFPYGTKDFSAAINKFKAENVEIVVSNMIPPDTATAWRQMYAMNWVPKMVSMGKAALFPTDMAALGENLANGISTELWWHPSFPYKSSLTGETAQELADAWTKDTGKQWAGPIAVSETLWEVAYDVLKRAGTLDKAKIRDAIAATDLDTVMGHIKYDDKHVAELPMTAGQWQKGEKWPWEIQIVNADQYPEIKTTAEILFPIPH